MIPWTAACQAFLSITNSWSLFNSYPSSQWCHPAISFSVVPFSSCLQSLPASLLNAVKHFSGEGNCTPLQYCCLKNPMDGGAWWATVRGVAKSWTRLSDFTFTFHFHALEKKMATHSSVLAWRIPGMGEHGGLPSMGLHRVGHDWSDLAAAAAAKHFRNSIIDFKNQLFVSI